MVRAQYIPTPRESDAIGRTVRYLSFHFDTQGVAPSSERDIIRRREPMNVQDAIQGRIGTRSHIWHPKHMLRRGIGGVDGTGIAVDGPDKRGN
jgi:hypothetical protein